MSNAINTMQDRSLEVVRRGLIQNPDVELWVYKTEADWKKARRDLVTASDIATLFGRSSYRSVLRLHYEKMGLLEDTSEETEWQRAGHYLEPAIAQWYADDTGREVGDPGPYTIITNKKYPGIGCTLDRVVWDKRLGLGILELKNRGLTTAEDWRAGVPDNVRMQMQAQMLVTGLSWGSAAALVGGNQFYWDDVFKNASFHLAMICRVSQFWKDVRAGVLPKPEGHPDDDSVLSELYPEDNGGTAQLPHEFLDVFEELRDIKAQEKALGQRADALKVAVKDAIKESTYGILPGYQFSLKSQTSAKSIRIADKGGALERAATVLDRAGIPYEISGGNTTRVLRMKETE